MTKVKRAAAEAKAALEAKSTTPVFKISDLLSSGSTLLNLTCSGHWQGAFPKGECVFFVGDSQSGKTFITLTCFAEACRSSVFRDYRLIHDNPERGALMNFGKFFGEQAARKIEAPRVVRGEGACSETIEEFYANVDDACEYGRPFVYVLDSMDVLSSKYEQKKFREAKVALRKNRKPKGDFGDGKAKVNSRHLRHVVAKLHKTGSILIVVCQTRDNIDAGLFESKKTRSGGRALKFYAAFEMWSSVGRSLKQTTRGQELPIGMTSKIKVSKNRLTGRDRQVEIPIYYDYGMDDIGSCLNWLVKVEHWQVKKGIVTVPEFSFEGTRDELIGLIESKGYEDDLRELTQEVWFEIENELALGRKPRY